MKNQNTGAVLEIDGIILPVTPDQEHEWTLSTEQVAIGYEVTPHAIQKHKERHADELIEGTHYTRQTNSLSGGLQRVTTNWTKLGVITLGWFIRSERAKRFRRMAAELILRLHEANESGNGLGDTTRIEAVIAEMAKMVHRSLDVMSRSLEIVARTQEMMVRQHQDLASRFDRMDKRFDILSECFFTGRQQVSLDTFERWQNWATDLARDSILIGTTEQFTLDDLIENRAPVDLSLRRPRNSVGAMMRRIAGKALEMGDGSQAIWHPGRSSDQRLWICSRSMPDQPFDRPRNLGLKKRNRFDPDAWKQED